MMLLKSDEVSQAVSMARRAASVAMACGVGIRSVSSATRPPLSSAPQISSVDASNAMGAS